MTGSRFPVLFFGLLGLILAGCAAPAQQLGGATMGTTWSVQYLADAALPDLHPGLQAELDLVVDQMSTWEPGSDISRFNRAPADSWVALPAELRMVLDHALRLAQQTDGAYDPTVGPLVDLWGFGALGAMPAPDDGAIAEARARVGWHRLQVDAKRGAVHQPGGTRLDLSSIAKGHAVDRLSAVLQANGVTDYLVDVGGELRAAGNNAHGRPWTVAIESPGVHDSNDDDATPHLRTVTLRDAAIATSGDYRRLARTQSKRISHEIDPRSGEPAQGVLASVSVIRADAMDADALATALFVLGDAHGMDFAERQGVAALFTRRADNGFKQRATAAWRELDP